MINEDVKNNENMQEEDEKEFTKMLKEYGPAPLDDEKGNSIEDIDDNIEVNEMLVDDLKKHDFYINKDGMTIIED